MYLNISGVSPESKVVFQRYHGDGDWLIDSLYSAIQLSGHLVTCPKPHLESIIHVLLLVIRFPVLLNSYIMCAYFLRRWHLWLKILHPIHIDTIF